MWRSLGLVLVGVTVGGCLNHSVVTAAGESGETGSTTTSPSTGSSSAAETSSDCDGAFICETTGEQPPWCYGLDPDPDCPEGMKCVPYGSDGHCWDAFVCVPVPEDPRGVGEPCIVEEYWCSGLDDCEAGAMCWFVDQETLEGTCVPMCTEAWAYLCPPGYLCAIGADIIPNPCLPFCDPLAQECPEHGACYPAVDGFGCANDGSGDAGAYGDPCDQHQSCDPGLYCVAAEAVLGCESPECCNLFCDVTVSDVCPPQTVCVPWYDLGEAPEGFEDVGFCQA